MIPFFHRFTKTTNLDSGDVCDNDDDGNYIYSSPYCDYGAKMKVPIYGDDGQLQSVDCYCSSNRIDEPLSEFKYIVPFSGLMQGGTYGLESCTDRFQFSSDLPAQSS